MSELRVWAPNANSVEVDLSGERTPLTRRARGWWGLGRALRHGEDYAFCVDDQGPYPDPRSRYQPHGVHGASRWVEFDQLERTGGPVFRAPPLSAAVIYELHVGTFTEAGTFAGVIERLDHVVELGVTHVELLPVNAFSGARGWGYDGVSWFAPHAVYGGPQGLATLVDACHARGLAVLIDVVYNHLGPEGNYLGKFGPYFADHYATPWGEAVNLDGRGSDEMRRLICDNARMWLRDYGVDGLRVDATQELFDRSALHVLEELAEAAHAVGREVGAPKVVIAESGSNDPRVIQPREVGGYAFDAQWSDDFHHALHHVLTGETAGYYAGFRGLKDLAKALERGFVQDGRYSEFSGKRFGRPLEGVPPSRLLGYLQDHDQVGNRALGERISETVGHARARAGIAVVLSAPFVPMLFMGEEWGASTRWPFFCDHSDAGLNEAVREGRRREFARFGWAPERIPDPADPETFRAARLRWEEREGGEHAETWGWYRRLLALRRERADLREDDFGSVRTEVGDGWLIVRRRATTVGVNFGAGEVTLPMSGEALAQSGEGGAVAGGWSLGANGAVWLTGGWEDDG